MSPSEAEEIKNTLDNHERRISEIEKLLKTKPQVLRKPLAIKEFILETQPKTDAQKTLAIGCFLEKYRDMSSFNATDLEIAFREAKERPPANMSREIGKNVQEGYLMEAAERKDSLKAWMLTNSGTSFVESHFTKD